MPSLVEVRVRFGDLNRRLDDLHPRRELRHPILHPRGEVVRGKAARLKERRVERGRSPARVCVTTPVITYDVTSAFRMTITT